jgi:hypothetical protein
MSDDSLPPHVPLTRHFTAPPSSPKAADDEYNTPEDPGARRARYLQYECNYRACKYKEGGHVFPVTWGYLVQHDYAHFVELMTQHVPLESTTYAALKGELLPPDQKAAENTVRFIDTDEAKAAQKERYLDMRCTHNGRMKNKVWRDILNTDYSYFLWSVGNTMGRDTRTFKTFFECLADSDKETVLKTPKGKVIAPKQRRAR